MSLGPIIATLKNHDARAFLQVSRDWRAMLRFHFLHAALESGLLRELDGPRSRDALIEALGVVRPEQLDALVDLGVSIGELKRTRRGIALKGHRSRALRHARNDALAAMVEANVTYYNGVFRSFSRSLTGEAPPEALEGFEPLVARLSQIAQPHVEHFLRKAAAGRRAPRVLDVGCGSGLNLRLVLDVDREARGVGLEIDPAVAAGARANFERWGLQGRALAVEGDAHALPQEARGPFDLILLMSVVYYLEVPERIALLETLRGHLAADGALAVTTSCRGPGMDPFSANLNMATSTMKGLTPLPTAAEMEEQLGEAGYTAVSRTRLIPGTSFFGFLGTR